MSRPPRIDFENAKHHVMSRGARRDRIFTDDQDRHRFLVELGRVHERTGVRVHAYALMPNHYHLLLESPKANLSRAMQQLNGNYSRYVNNRFDWIGPLFGGRFNSRLVQSDAHWRYLLIYLHLNPVRAGLVEAADEARWTSHSCYVGLSATPPWLTTDELTTAYGSISWYRRRLEQVRRGLGEPPEGLDPAALWVRGPVVVPRQSVARATTANALGELEQALGLDGYQLSSRLQGPDQRPRWVAAWWMERRTGRTHREIASTLGAARPQISTWIATVQRRREADVTLTAWIQRLQELAEAGRPADRTAQSRGPQRAREGMGAGDGRKETPVDKEGENRDVLLHDTGTDR